jgi:hypothetical protein
MDVSKVEIDISEWRMQPMRSRVPVAGRRGVQQALAGAIGLWLFGKTWARIEAHPMPTAVH